MDIIETIKFDRERGTRMLIAAYGDRLFRTAVVFCGDVGVAEDLVMRTFVQAIGKIGEFKRESSLFTWLYRILRNFYLMDRRGKMVEALEFRDELPDREDPRPNPADCLTRKTDARLIRHLVTAMPPILREVIVCRYFNDMSESDMAITLGIPEGTVKSRLNLARKWLREKMRRTDWREDASKN